jgi:hypothetical protein
VPVKPAEVPKIPFADGAPVKERKTATYATVLEIVMTAHEE